MRPLTRLALGTLAAAPIAVAAACGSSAGTDDPGPGPDQVTVTAGADGVQAVDVDADDQFRFTPDTIRVSVGKVRITLHNTGHTPHNMLFRTLDDAALPTTNGGESQVLDFTVSTPGEYQFVCSLHEQVGQTGTLIVKSS